MKALGHYVLVRPMKIEDKEGIIIPKHVKQKYERAGRIGTVLSVGPIAYKDYYDGRRWCEEGDIVMYARYGGEDVVTIDPDTGDETFDKMLVDKDVYGLPDEEDLEIYKELRNKGRII